MGARGRYDDFGWDYEAWNPGSGRETAWYLRHAREAGGKVLELACGTGRLVAALAEDGHEVVGLDLSPAMLDRARERVAALPPEVRARIRLVRADMADFHLDERFALAVIADNSFREVETREALLRCLRCVRMHLAPGGRLLVTERRFDPGLYSDGVREHPFGEPMPHPETGEPVRRRVRVRYDAAAGRIEGEMTYRIARPGGRVEETTYPYSGPVLDPDGYRALFGEAGFEARLCVGYEEREDDGAEPMLCFVLGVS